jgi:hypothetical protein
LALSALKFNRERREVAKWRGAMGPSLDVPTGSISVGPDPTYTVCGLQSLILDTVHWRL